MLDPTMPRMLARQKARMKQSLLRDEMRTAQLVYHSMILFT
ncbi:Piso0_000584 [Millerozyma farinosa CBS 7064]|uniref:Piso0_000584 protein n=1 Tax=Pichia sorbitophila (strain ATCC MYA-4447 / BCRC 22081 / CBS 7064 / NBRC 10061 / NRRL Y-12695) TaxID=559304 RepID=G8YSS5_PICSO|nr:Piso0_000584 [Millerozyma farinosa CBS 7064]CCE73537.1 Piso0_000584 [Millerozyma farinosa CBS 7064]